MPQDLNSPSRLRWEKRCIRKSQRGDTAAFAALYEAYAQAVYSRILLPRLANVTAAEDALAETFQTALERLDRFEPKGISIWFWLARIARNKATDMHRARERTGRALANFEGLLAPLRSDLDAPGTVYERREDTERLRQEVKIVLAQLNPRYQRVIQLRFLEDRPRTECADLLEVKLGTLDVLVLRALRAFRKEWTKAMGPSTRE